MISTKRTFASLFRRLHLLLNYALIVRPTSWKACCSVLGVPACWPVQNKIGMDNVSFHELGKDAFGKPVERQVNKRLYSSAGEQQ